MNGNIECAFIGRLAADPEAKTSAAGNPWVKLRAGVGEGESVQWLKIAAFGDVAREAAGTLHKGYRVYVEGKLKLEEWTNSDGQHKAGLSVAAWKVEKLGQIGRKKPLPEGDHPAPLAASEWRRDGLADDPPPF